MNDIFVFIEHFQGGVSDISFVCLAQAQSIARSVGSKVIAVLLGEHVEPLTQNLLADEVLTVDHASLKDFLYDEYTSALTSIISDRQPGLILFGDTSIGSDLAGGLSARLNLPLVSFCTEIKLDGGKLRFVAQICGGKIFAEGDLPAGTTLVTLLPGKFKPTVGQSKTVPQKTSYPSPQTAKSRIKLKEIVIPSGEDIDITKEKILISIGRGIENADNVSFIQELADELGGALCASRPVVDQGWLPTSRLVGKSGKTVKPKVYLVLGVSGAPEHVEAIGGSDLIIAVNTDPNAPIFNIAKYGTTEDMLDFSKELIQSIQEIKGA